MSFRQYSVKIVAALLVLIVAAGGDASAEAASYTYASEHLRLVASFNGDGVTIELSDGRRFVLPQTVSASGARYSDGDVIFWTKGDEAYVTLDDVDYTVRIVDEATDVWERAKAAGVNFRGVGQEPGWIVEIRDGDSMHLTLDYGLTELTTPLAAMEIDYARGMRTYRADPPTSPFSIAVYVLDDVCYDSMSGEGFTGRVFVELHDSGQSYAGCGRDL